MTLQELLDNLGVSDYTGFTDEQLAMDVQVYDAHDDQFDTVTGVRFDYDDNRVTLEL